MNRPACRPATLPPALVLTLALALSACAGAPEYARPPIAVAAAFKEAPPPMGNSGPAENSGPTGTTGQAGSVWQPAQPAEPQHGMWWRLFDDRVLDALVADADLANQDLRVAEAQLRQARAATTAARAGLYPSVAGSASVSREGAGGTSTGNNYSLGASVAWEVDLWGRVRNSIAAADALAAASAADLAAARLSIHAQLAQSYFQLRVAEAQGRLLDETAASYQRSLQLTRDRLAAGVATRADVAQAEAQLKVAQAQRLDLGIARAQLEHALAVLTGRAPADLTLAAGPLVEAIPAVPAGVPSRLLERRPDIAGAERRVAAANAQIGVARAAYYPSLTLSADGGFRATRLGDWLTLPSRVWSLGPALAGMIFDGGARAAANEQALAAYDATVATYRQTVLGAFQDVEDNLAALRILVDEEQRQREALAAARLSLDIVTRQYKAGTVSYLSVIQVQTTALQSEQAVLALRGRRLAATVALAKALGGSW
ncbi:MAG: efflux transporter outer membrane subunit [Burkholderiaceae bacterium]|nr:efflux transporter outer membrane subunit [Burkholderiaceae bacterium]